MTHRSLVIDQGNTRLKMGIFEMDELIHSESAVPDRLDVSQWQGWIETYAPDRIGLATTVLLSDDQISWINSNKVLQVASDLKYPFSIEYRTPETLGQDRLAAVSAVYSLYSGRNVLVIDYGTCITYDFLTADGRYIGGNIAPGIQMRLKSMHDYTAQLPLVKLPVKVSWIGQSTEEALQNGGLTMAILESNGLIFYLKEKYGHLTIILTGGDAEYFENNLAGEHEMHSDLVLSGLNEILKNNEN